MASQDIPCSECESKKDIIEANGMYVVTGCESIAGRPGWCKITWKLRTQSNN